MSSLQLNVYQRAVVSTVSEHSIVHARPGSGKTTALATKVHHLIDNCDIDPQQIIVLTHTNVGVSRLRNKLRPELACVVRTINSYCVALHAQYMPRHRLVTDYELM